MQDEEFYIILLRRFYYLFRRRLIVMFDLTFYFLYGCGMKIGQVAQLALGTFSHFFYWL
jgi:integrase